MSLPCAPSSFDARFSDEELQVMDLDVISDLEYLLDLQTESVEGAPLAGTSFEILPMNHFESIPSSLGFNSTVSSLDMSTFAMRDMLEGEVDLRFSPQENGFGEGAFDSFAFGEGGDFMLFDMNMEPDVELQSFVMDDTPVTSQCSTTFSSSNNLQALAILPTEKLWSQNNEEVVHGDAVFAPPMQPSPSSFSDSIVVSAGPPFTNNNRPKLAEKKQAKEDSKWIFITSNSSPSKSFNPRIGIRRGQLPPKARKKARRIREIGACWKCWVQKVPCSVGAPCETCVKHFSGMAVQMCWRSRLVEFVPVFFPEYLHGHLGKREVDEFVAANSKGFMKGSVEVSISAGQAFEPMRIQARVFQPKSWELLGQYHLMAENGKTPRLVQRYSAPLGIMNLSRAEMKAQCRKWIDEMVASPHYTLQVTAGHESKIPATVLEIAKKYDTATNNDSLVHEALTLHAMQYFMGVLLTFTEESKSSVHQQVEHIGAPEGEYLTSRLLNRQIKHVMHLLHREMYQSVLEGLEKSLKSSAKKDSWSNSFCTLLVLCLCIEELQTAADTFVMSDMQLNSSSLYTCKTSGEACLALEEVPFQQFMRLFHDVYRSGREGRVISSRDGGLNPFRYGGSDKKSVFLDFPTNEMIGSVHQMICQSYGEIIELAARPVTIENCVNLSQVKPHHTGRMAARFLNSFLESEAT